MPEAVLAKYPGWTPRECRTCRAVAPARPAGAEGARRSTGARRAASVGAHSLTASHRFTPQEVLDRYTDGPVTGVFTDGGASPNPGPGGWGFVWVEDDVIRAERSGHHPETTNNRMELTALAEALRVVPRGTPVTVHADSELVVHTFMRWAVTWASNGWKRKGGPLKNLDLVQPIHAEMISRPEVSLVWVPAHAGWRWNEYADALAGAWNRGRGDGDRAESRADSPMPPPV